MKKLTKILDLLDTFPEIEWIKQNDFLSEAVLETISDYLEDERNKRKNFRYYPWINKIWEKRKELFGF